MGACSPYIDDHTADREADLDSDLGFNGASSFDLVPVVDNATALVTGFLKYKGHTPLQRQKHRFATA